MSIPLSTHTGYLHQPRIHWAVNQPSESKPTWEIGFSYGIFPLTVMPFEGTCTVYTTDGRRLWVRDVNFDKAHGDFASLLERGLDHAFAEVGDEAVRAVVELESKRRLSASGPTKNLTRSGSPHVKRMANGMQLRVRLPAYHPSDWDTLLEKPLQQKFSRPEYKLLVLGSAGEVPYLRVVPASGVEEDVFLRAVKKDINALIREIVKLHNEKGSDIQLFSLVREVGSDNRDLIRSISNIT